MHLYLILYEGWVYGDTLINYNLLFILIRIRLNRTFSTPFPRHRFVWRYIAMLCLSIYLIVRSDTCEKKTYFHKVSFKDIFSVLISEAFNWVSLYNSVFPTWSQAQPISIESYSAKSCIVTLPEVYNILL